MIASRLEPIIQEGQHLEKLLQESVGKPSRTPLIFTETETVIVEAGETITNPHLSKVQRIVKDRLDELEAELKDQKQREIEHMRADLVAWVGHDLQTPLASIRAILEALADGVVEDPQSVQRYLLTAQRDVRSLSSLMFSPPKSLLVSPPPPRSQKISLSAGLPRARKHPVQVCPL